MALQQDAELTELYERSRAQFPVFDASLGHMAFMENAGGSQVSTNLTGHPVNGGSKLLN